MAVLRQRCARIAFGSRVVEVFRELIAESEKELWSPLDAPPVWRYSGKDALASPSVPGVEVFRELIAESEKELASQP
jgi:hypothetical protein